MMYLTRGQKAICIVIGIILAMVATPILFGDVEPPQTKPLDVNSLTIEEFDNILEEIKSK